MCGYSSVNTGVLSAEYVAHHASGMFALFACECCQVAAVTAKWSISRKLFEGCFRGCVTACSPRFSPGLLFDEITLLGGASCTAA
jgi:hypothetical protein